MKTTLRRFALVAAFAFAASAVMASDYLEPRSRTVSLGDLNLTTQEGVASAYRRIQRAADSVCSNFSRANLAQHALWKTCTTTAVEQAIAKVNAPALTAYADSVRKPQRPVKVAAVN